MDVNKPCFLNPQSYGNTMVYGSDITIVFMVFINQQPIRGTVLCSSQGEPGSDLGT